MSRNDILDLQHRYAHAVGTRDQAAWASTWDANASWELGKGRSVEGREAIVEMWNNAMDSFNAVIQNVLNGACVLDEEAGTGTGTYALIEHTHRANGDRAMMLAYYDDTYVRTDGKWLFASRELVPQYVGGADLSGTFLNAWGDAEK